MKHFLEENRGHKQLNLQILLARLLYITKTVLRTRTPLPKKADQQTRSVRSKLLYKSQVHLLSRCQQLIILASTLVCVAAESMHLADSYSFYAGVNIAKAMNIIAQPWGSEEVQASRVCCSCRELQLNIDAEQTAALVQFMQSDGAQVEAGLNDHVDHAQDHQEQHIVEQNRSNRQKRTLGTSAAPSEKPKRRRNPGMASAAPHPSGQAKRPTRTRTRTRTPTTKRISRRLIESQASAAGGSDSEEEREEPQTKSDEDFIDNEEYDDDYPHFNQP